MPRRIRQVLIATVVIVLAIFAIVALQVDDWSRDLTTNRATTSSDNFDRTLRSLELTASVEEVHQAISQFVASRADWTLGAHTSDEGDAMVVPLVRISRLFGFADDVSVSLQPTTTGTLVDVVSQSRVGKGDLGQNPRNIRKILQSLRSAFVTPGSAKVLRQVD